MVETVIVKAFDREIVEAGPRIEFRKRARGALAVGLIAGVAAAGVYAAGAAMQELQGEYRALGRFAMGAAGLMAIVGALAGLGALFLAWVPSRRVFAVWDGAARSFRARGRVVPFADIARVAVVTSASGFPTLCVETTSAGTMPIWFATGAQAAAIDALAARLNAALAPAVFAPAGALRDAAPSSPAAIEQNFRTVVILAIGVLWTGAGYFFFRGLSFASRHDPDGLRIPVWSAGLLILALGVYEWIKSRRR